MDYEVIDGRSYHRMSEFLDYLPHGVLNKVKTDTGGTYLAANCPENYIIVCPLNGLIDSISNDVNNHYEIFVCNGGVVEKDWKLYNSRNKIHKIAVTWDSFHKLMCWLPDFNYKVVADEYHLILQNMDFREEALNHFMFDIKKFSHYTFMSATPLDFEPQFLADLPHYRIDWGELVKITPLRYRTNNLVKGLTRMLQIFLSEGLSIPDVNGELTEVKELHIFINSVTSIKQILDVLQYDDVKIVCANRIHNRKLLDTYPVSKVTAPNCVLNFYTSTAFQGCNMFTNNGLIIVASDAYKLNGNVDVMSDLEQIVGRFRYNDQYQNCFRNTIIHLYSTNEEVPSNEEFEEDLQKKIHDGQELVDLCKNGTASQIQILRSRINLENDVVSIRDDKLYINDLKIQMFRYKQSLKMMYKNGYTVRKAYLKSTKFNNVDQRYWEDLNVKMSRAMTFSYKDLYLDYVKTKDPSYLEEYPEFKEYSEYLKDSEMRTLQYCKDKLCQLARDKRIFRCITMRDIWQYYGGKFVSSKELKTFIKTSFAEHKVYRLSAKASLVEEYGCVATAIKVNGMSVKGYNIRDLTLNFSSI